MGTHLYDLFHILERIFEGNQELRKEVLLQIQTLAVPLLHMSRIVRKPDFCLGENKGADQLRGNREADQRLCFRYMDSIFPLLLISEISSF